MTDKVKRCSGWLLGKPSADEVKATVKKFDNRLQEIGDEHPETEETVEVIELLSEYLEKIECEIQPTRLTSELGDSPTKPLKNTDYTLGYEEGDVTKFDSSKDKQSAFEALKASLGTKDIVTNRKTFDLPEAEEPETV